MTPLPLPYGNSLHFIHILHEASLTRTKAAWIQMEEAAPQPSLPLIPSLSPFPLTCTGSPPHPVDVDFREPWCVVVDNDLNCRDVETSRIQRQKDMEGEARL